MTPILTPESVAELLCENGIGSHVVNGRQYKWVTVPHEDYKKAMKALSKVADGRTMWLGHSVARGPWLLRAERI